MDENAKRHCAFIIYHQFYELWSWGASESRVVDSFAITSYVDRHRYSPFRGVEKDLTVNLLLEDIELSWKAGGGRMHKNFVEVQYQ